MTAGTAAAATRRDRRAAQTSLPVGRTLRRGAPAKGPGVVTIDGKNVRGKNIPKSV